MNKYTFQIDLGYIKRQVTYSGTDEADAKELVLVNLSDADKDRVKDIKRVIDGDAS